MDIQIRDELRSRVLGNVTLRRTGTNKGISRYNVMDLQGRYLMVVSIKSGMPIRDVVADALIERYLICGVCRGLLLEGETAICSLCEAGQVADLRRVLKDLSSDVCT